MHADLISEGTQARSELVRQIIGQERMIVCQPVAVCRHQAITTVKTAWIASRPILGQIPFRILCRHPFAFIPKPAGNRSSVTVSIDVIYYAETTLLHSSNISPRNPAISEISAQLLPCNTNINIWQNSAIVSSFHTGSVLSERHWPDGRSTEDNEAIALNNQSRKALVIQNPAEASADQPQSPQNNDILSPLF